MRGGRLPFPVAPRNRRTMFGLANPDRFMRFTRPVTPVLWGLALVLLAVGTWLSFTAPADYQQGDTVRIMFIHVPAATLGLGAYAALGVSASSPWSSAIRWPTPPPAPPPCRARC